MVKKLSGYERIISFIMKSGLEGLIEKRRGRKASRGQLSDASAVSGNPQFCRITFSFSGFSSRGYDVYLPHNENGDEYATADGVTIVSLL